jgi:lambda family phage tail tape measure protein
MSFLARLGVVLGLDTAEFSKGLGDAKQQLRQFETNVKSGMALAGAAMAAATMKVVQFADEIKDTAASADVAIGTVLDVGHALQLAGGSAENAGKVLANFNKVVGEAAMGDKAAQEMFKQLGVSLQDLSQMSIEQLFRKTADALGSMDDNAKRVALGMQAFGRGIRGVDIKGFNDQMEQGHGLTKAQQKAFEDAAAAMDILDNATHNLKVSMVEFMGTGAASFIRFLSEGINGIGKMIEAMANLLRKFDEWNEKNSQFTEEYDAWSGRVTGESPYFKPLSKEGESNPSGSGRNVTPYKDTSAENKLAQLLKQLETLRFMSIEFENQLKLQVQGIEVQTQTLFMTKNQAEVYQAMYELEKKRASEVASMEQKRAEAVAAKADKKVIEEIDNQIAKINELSEVYQQRISDAIIANQTLSQSVEGGLLASFQRFQFAAVDSAHWVEMGVDSVFANMTNAINQFVETGKFSFADFTKAIIQDLIKIQMQMLITQLFAKAIGFALGSFGGVSGTPYTSAGQMTAGTSMVAGSPMTVTPLGQADGGGVGAGLPYYVGETGPELFVPSRSGTIIPNKYLGGNDQPQIVYNGPYIQNMSAIDTQSATQFLARNKDAVYAANMSASRSIPTSVR